MPLTCSIKKFGAKAMSKSNILKNAKKTLYKLKLLDSNKEKKNNLAVRSPKVLIFGQF